MTLSYLNDEALYKLIFEHIMIGLLTFDEKGKIIACNQVFEKILGATQSEITKMNMLKVPDEKVVYAVEKALSGEIGYYEGKYQSIISGKETPLKARFVPLIENGRVRGGLGMIEDISDQKQVEKLINHMVYHDQLTNLPNRFLFKDRLHLAFSRAKREKKMLAILFIDLDRFKNINDTLGHDKGDQILQGVSERLHTLVDTDKFTLARYGGDEFIVLLPEIDHSEEAAKISKNIVKGLADPWSIGGHDIHVTASIGISLFPSDGEDIDTLVKHADVATHRAKEMGRNRYEFYTPSMNEKAFEKLSLESSLRKAITQNEFFLCFQPQVDIKSRKIIGMEALIRWKHPFRGLVSPAEFIPLAEETGLIIPIGEWVLQKACMQNKLLQKEGYSPIRVAVNLSVSQFQQPDIVEVIKRVLAETELDPQYLEIELTESVIIQDVEDTFRKIKELKEMGIQIAIDDFGTGYSSLSYLRNLFIDTLKIDRSFVKDVTTKNNDALISSAIINLAQNLKINVVAEGVETQEQLEFFQARSCDKMQGFLFSKPIIAAELKPLLVEWNGKKVI